MYKKRQPGVPPSCSATEKAYRLLEKRDYSEKGLYDKLKSLYYPEDEARAAVEVCVKRNFVNDRRYGEVLCRRYSEGYGDRRVLSSMIAKGIPTDLAKEIIEAAKEEDETDDTMEKLVSLISKKLRGAPLTKENRPKISAFLARKGYSGGEVFAAMKTFDQNYETIDDADGSDF